MMHLFDANSVRAEPGKVTPKMEWCSRLIMLVNPRQPIQDWEFKLMWNFKLKINLNFKINGH